MSQLIQLRQKIRSIQTTKKITQAVRLVSMSLYGKLEKQQASLHTYTQNIKEVFGHLLLAAPDWHNPILFPDDIHDSKPLFIVISTSKGLCGSLNSNLFRYLKQSVFIEKQQTPSFITIGKKADHLVEQNNLGKIIWRYKELSSNNFVSIAEDLVTKIIHGKEQFSSISFFSSYLKTFFLQKPKKTTLIPLETDISKTQGKATKNNVEQNIDNNAHKPVCNSMIWEQEKLKTLDYLAIRYIRSIILNLLYDALLAEHAARFLAMDSSTTNAEKFLEKLTLQYNKQRQSLITREVSELSASLPEG